MVKNGGIFGDGERGTWRFCDVAIHGSEFMVYFCTLLEVPEKGRTV